MSDDDADVRLGARPLTVWLWSGIWLIYLIIPLVDTWSRSYRPWQQGTAMVGFWVFCYAYTRLVGRNRVDRDGLLETWGLDRVSFVYLGTMIALALALPLVSSPDWIALWIYVSSACGSALPFERRKWALLGGVAATAALVIQGTARGVDAGTWGWMVLPSIFSCFAVIGIRRMRNLIRELHQAREEVKHLAANEERLRMARDLHDLAGHSMATITLKAELARRLMPVDAAAAEKQVADIEQVSRQALADIREAVSGYRRATLAVETASARTALEAAQINFEDDPALVRQPSGLEPEAEAALAWCLREAVTNVVRHSGATWCRARLIDARVNGEHTVTLEVTDNGAAVPRTGNASGTAGGEGGAGTGSGPVIRSDASRGAAEHWGNGLTGLRERLAPFSATLTAAPVAPHGFRLSATLRVD
jgi:two-component system, NarL family, sensor histidine kinase DesK